MGDLAVKRSNCGGIGRSHFRSNATIGATSRSSGSRVRVAASVQDGREITMPSVRSQMETGRP